MDNSLRRIGCQEITREFMESMRQLELGELLHSSHFTLLDAMSAIELMDPKMDSGLVLKKTPRRIMSLEESVKAGTVKVNNLSPEELLGIIDDTYSCLSAWLDGYPLWSNVMTNLYLHEPDLIEDHTLKMFSQSILKLVAAVDKLIYHICCIEEEDFVLNLGKFKLANNMTDHKALVNLESLCQQYERALADKGAPKGTSGATGTKQNNNPILNELPALQPDMSKTHLSSFISRLRFTYHFYSAFFNMNKCLPKNYQEEPMTSPADQQKTVKLVQQSAKDCDQHLEKSLRYLADWEQTIELGIKPTPKPQQDTSVVNDDYPTVMGFDPLINLMFLTPAYPRSPCIKTRPTALIDLRRLIGRLRECIQMSRLFDKVSLMDSLESVEYLSKYSKLGSSCVLSRSFVQALYTPNRSVVQLQDKLLQSLNDFCEPLVQVMKTCPNKQAALDNFLVEGAKTFSSIINLYGHNSARQHERLADVVASFKSLQYTAVMINAEHNNVIIYSWTTYHLARLCVKYITAGMELELFSAHEFPYVYWYLYDVLHRSEKEQLEMARQFIIDRTAFEENQKKSKLNDQRRKIIENTIYHDKCLIHNKAFRFLTGGSFLLTHGLKLQNKIKSPLLNGFTNDDSGEKKPLGESDERSKPIANNYTSEEICFNHRFRSLMGTGVYQSYSQMLSKLNNLEYIYNEALECFTEAKKLFETIDNTNYDNCLKVCKKNIVVSRILANNLNSFQNREVEFSFDTHPSFPTLKV